MNDPGPLLLDSRKLGSARHLSVFHRYIVYVAFGYAAATVATFVIKQSVTLIDVVTIGRIF